MSRVAVSTPAPALRTLATGALALALLLAAANAAWEGRTRLSAHATAAAEARLATAAAALAGALGGPIAAQRGPAVAAADAGRAAGLPALRLGRPSEDDGYWEAESDARGGPWHAPLPGLLAAPAHEAAWGSAVVGQIGFAQDDRGRWAYARPAGAAATLLVGVLAPAGWRDTPSRGPWVGLLLVGLMTAAAGAFVAARRLGGRGKAVERLRRAGLAAAVGRPADPTTDAPPRLAAEAGRLERALATVLVAGAASDAKLEAHRRRRELVRALGWQAQHGEAGPDQAFAAGWPAVGGELPDASGWVRGPAGALAWFAPERRDEAARGGKAAGEPGGGALAAAARRAAIAALAERALARFGADEAALEAALAPLLADEVEALIWAPGDGRLRVFGRAPRPATVLAPGGARRGQPLPANGTLQLAPGETLVLCSGDAGTLATVLDELEGLVQLPQADAAQLVALIEGAAGELAGIVAAPVGLVTAVAGGAG